MADIKVRVGQQNTVKIISSVSGAAGGRSEIAKNVIGGIASVTQLSVSGVSTHVGVSTFQSTLFANRLSVAGVSTFIGIATFLSDVYINGDLYIQDDLRFDEFIARNAIVTGIISTNNLIAGISTVNTFYYTPSYTNGVAYFNSSGLMVSTGSTSSSIDYTNYILTTDNSGIPIWSNVIDGGSY